MNDVCREIKYLNEIRLNLEQSVFKYKYNSYHNLWEHRDAELCVLLLLVLV
jgi:hypothetical protein